MPDHVHGLISLPADEQLARVVGDWKRFTTRKTGVVWQGNFFDHRLRNHESVDLKASYIRQNPIRAGLIPPDAIWPWQWEPNDKGAMPPT
jgi:putative transposase